MYTLSICHLTGRVALDQDEVSGYPRCMEMSHKGYPMEPVRSIGEHGRAIHRCAVLCNCEFTTSSIFSDLDRLLSGGLVSALCSRDGGAGHIYNHFRRVYIRSKHHLLKTAISISYVLNWISTGLSHKRLWGAFDPLCSLACVRLVSHTARDI